MKHARLLIAAGLLFTACRVVADAGQLLERLRLDHAAMVAAEQDFHERRQRGSLNGTEAADYAAYVARLHRRRGRGLRERDRRERVLDHDADRLVPVMAADPLDLRLELLDGRVVRDLEGPDLAGFVADAFAEQVVYFAGIMLVLGVLMMLIFFHVYFAPFRRLRQAVERQVQIYLPVVLNGY